MADLRERQIFFFTCNQCGKPKRQSIRVHIAKVEICRKCRSKNAIPKGQVEMFGGFDPALPGGDRTVKSEVKV